MSISDRLDEITARCDAATEGPWERGDHYHVQAASHCQCWPEHGPLISEKRMDINGTMRLAHVHRRSEPLWEYGIYAPTEYGGALVVNETSEYGYMDDADAEFIAASRTDVPALVAALRAVLDLHKPMTMYEHEDCCENDSDDHREERHAEDVVHGGEFFCMDLPTGIVLCAECSRDLDFDGRDYPCPTVRAVTAALGEGT